jgi:23S rRNA pseudouridine1911/1915/1917 synthase
VPTDRGETNTLLDRVGEYLRHKRGVRQAFVVHRLDRGVSGLMLFAKNRDVAQQLQELFRTRAISRTYLAVVSGTMENASGTFQSHLATAENLDRFSTANGREGELAVTHYRVLKQLPDVALVEVKLETGRRNQIRVHFAEAGHPVLGDERYGGANARRAPWSEHRLALHAERLDFVHPQTRKKLALRSPLPKEFEGVVSAGI